MFDFASLSRRQRIIQRNRTERLSDLLDWKNLGIVSCGLKMQNEFANCSCLQYYRKARQLALHRTHPEILQEDTIASKLKYPRPISEPPSPSTSRATTPAPSTPGSDNESDEEANDQAELDALNNKDSLE